MHITMECMVIQPTYVIASTESRGNDKEGRVE